MDHHDEVILPDVSPEQLASLQQQFRAKGGTVGTGPSGLAENSCFAIKYNYDATRKLLTIDPLRLMPNLKPSRLRKTILGLMAPPRPKSFALDSGSTIYKPTPHSCATYNWAIGFITNNSGGALTYSDQSTDHGDLSVAVPSIAAGAQPSDHQDGFWTNQGTKDSGLGCFGSISYQLADGVTTLKISYGVNTLSTTSCSAALSGQNAARYTATVDKQDDFYYAAAYLYPYVTIAPKT